MPRITFNLYNQNVWELKENFKITYLNLQVRKLRPDCGSNPCHLAPKTLLLPSALCWATSSVINPSPFCPPDENEKFYCSSFWINCNIVGLYKFTHKLYSINPSEYFKGMIPPPTLAGRARWWWSRREENGEAHKLWEAKEWFHQSAKLGPWNVSIV